ncbi:MAG: glycosyltransferase family 4 protein [Solirubrobacteraceae bacterium]
MEEPCRLRESAADVVFFTLNYHPGEAGGAERQARLQAEELVRRGHRVLVVCPRSRGPRTGKVGGVDVLRLPKLTRKPFRRISYALVLVPWLLAVGRRFDVWHVHLASTQADLVVFVGLLTRTPTYVKIASGGKTGEVQQFAPLGWATRRVGLRRATRVQALSAEIADELTTIGVIHGRVVRIPNGLDLTAFSPPDARRKLAMRTKLGLPLDQPIALYAGRFAEYKGIGDLLEAWRRISQNQGLLVLLGARGPEDEPFPVPDRGRGFVTREWTPAVIEYLHAADVFVHPSHQDGMSNALLEAMACGLAPLATGIRAVEGLLEDERNALLVPPSHPPELSRSLVRLLGDRALRERIGAAAARTAREYSISDVVSEIEQVYAELVTRC